MAMEIVSQDMPFVKDNSLIRIDFIKDETPVVSSLDVARHFQKKHKHILEEIRKIIANAPELFTGPNFRPSEYTDPTGRMLVAYQMTRDGFYLLAMGFTGQVALRWRVRYIEAFNALEAAARENIRTAALAEAHSLPALEAERKTAYLDGMKEGSRLQKRRDGLARLLRIREYIAKGLSHSEIGKILGVSRQSVSDTLARAKRAGLLAGNMREVPHA